MKDLDWIATAKTFVGMHETKDIKKLDMMLKDLKAPSYITNKMAWCGTFVAYCLKQHGITYPRHWYRALDYLNYGAKLKAPCVGAVAIKTRKGGGHVCFVVGKTKDNKLVCLGGNQSDSVCYAIYKQSDFEEFRWYGRTNTPAIGRYNLPIMTNVTRTSVKES